MRAGGIMAGHSLWEVGRGLSCAEMVQESDGMKLRSEHILCRVTQPFLRKSEMFS